MIRYFLQHKVSVLVIVGVLVLIGALALSTLPVSLLPNISIPQIRVSVNDATLSSTEMEKKVAQPLRSQLAGLTGAEDIHSISADGKCALTITFAYGTDLSVAALNIGERIERVFPQLPPTASYPLVEKFDTRQIPVQTIIVTPNVAGIAQIENYGDLCDKINHLFKRQLEQCEEIDVTIRKEPTFTWRF